MLTEAGDATTRSPTRTRRNIALGVTLLAVITASAVGFQDGAASVSVALDIVSTADFADSDLRRRSGRARRGGIADCT